MSKKRKDIRKVVNNPENQKYFLKPLNQEQADAVETISNPDNTVVFLDGVAGTGKSHLATAYALDRLMHGDVDKIILTRPIAEVGFRMGHLPGDIDSKISVWVYPIYDIILKYISAIDLKKLKDAERIQIRPLAYMRGSSFENAVVILDEAQNVTPKEMQMFLTRISYGSKIIVTGDKAQSDINVSNGFEDALKRFANTKGIAISKLTTESVVRHPIVKLIIQGYNTEPFK